MFPFRPLATAAVAALCGMSAVANAQLNIVCSAPAELCKALAVEFQKETGIQAMIVNTAGRAALNMIAEQKGKPQSDVWFGGPAEAHYRAAKFGLVDAYASPTAKELQPWAQKVVEQSKAQSVGVFARVLGIGYNSALATQKKLAPPACWKDLAQPGYAGEVHIGDPRTSGAAYFAIAGMSQIFGEDQAFKYLKAMYKAPPPPAQKGRGDLGKSLPKSSAPAGSPKGGGRVTLGGAAKGGGGKGGAAKAGTADEVAGGPPPVGNALAGIGFIGEIVAEAEGGASVKAVAPCEGTILEVDALSVIKGARNLDNAKKFADWALSAKAQALVVKVGRSYPASTAVASAPLAPKFGEIKFIDYDRGKYEKTPMHMQLTNRWNAETKRPTP